MSEWRQRATAGLKPGDTFIVERTFEQSDTEAFGHLTRDFNPVHYETRFAQAKNLAGLICHGLLTGSMVCELGGQLALLASEMNFSFKRPVYFGDTITCKVTFIAIDERGRATFEASLTNQRAQEVISARVVGLLPSESDRSLLAEMVAEGDPTNPLR